MNSPLTFIYDDISNHSSIRAIVKNRDELLSFGSLCEFLDEYSMDWLCPTIFDFNRASSYIASRFRRGRGNTLIANFDLPFTQYIMSGLNKQSFKIQQLHDASIEGAYLAFLNQYNEYDRPFQYVDQRWYLNPYIGKGEIMRLSFPKTVDFH